MIGDKFSVIYRDKLFSVTGRSLPRSGDTFILQQTQFCIYININETTAITNARQAFFNTVDARKDVSDVSTNQTAM